MEREKLLTALLNAIDYIEEITGDGPNYISHFILGLEMDREEIVDMMEEEYGSNQL